MPQQLSPHPAPGGGPHRERRPPPVLQVPPGFTQACHPQQLPQAPVACPPGCRGVGGWVPLSHSEGQAGPLIPLQARWTQDPRGQAAAAAPLPSTQALVKDAPCPLRPPPGTGMQRVGPRHAITHRLRRRAGGTPAAAPPGRTVPWPAPCGPRRGARGPPPAAWAATLTSRSWRRSQRRSPWTARPPRAPMSAAPGAKTPPPGGPRGSRRMQSAPPCCDSAHEEREGEFEARRRGATQGGRGKHKAAAVSMAAGLGRGGSSTDPPTAGPPSWRVQEMAAPSSWLLRCGSSSTPGAAAVRPGWHAPSTRCWGRQVVGMREVGRATVCPATTRGDEEEAAPCVCVGHPG